MAFLYRRKFLYGAGAIVLMPVALCGCDPQADSTAATQSTAIIKRKLGKTDIELPIVGMGVMNADNPAVIQESYKTGVRLFDTADAYQNGRNEAMLGRVFENLNVRKHVIIQTKSHPALLMRQSTAAERTRSLLEKLDESLARLKTDYVDIFLVHAPTADQMTDSGIKEALLEMKKLKKARYIGISHHQHAADVLDLAVKEGIYDTATISFNFTMAQDAVLIGAIRNAAKAGMGIIAMKTQAGGGGRGAGVNHTAALKWALRNLEITAAIPGYTNFDHMREDFSVAYGLDYTNVEKKFLAGKNLQASVRFCLQCETCRRTCPNGVDIPALMRTHMYAANYGNFVHARAALEEIAENVGLKNCADCSGCGARCVNHVSIADNIRNLKAMYL